MEKGTICVLPHSFLQLLLMAVLVSEQFPSHAWFALQNYVSNFLIARDGFQYFMIDLFGSCQERGRTCC